MSQITFDTLKFAKKLKSSGVPDSQAEAQAEAFAEIFTVSFEKVATKDDLERLAEQLEGKLERLAERLEGKIELAISGSKQGDTELAGDIRLLKWMIGFGLAGMVTGIALLARLVLMK
jgi:hypothetical protein